MKSLISIVASFCVLAAAPANAGLFSLNYVVEVSAFSGGTPVTGTKYVIVPADPKKAGTLEFREVAKNVERAMRANGLILADDATAADVTIVVDYGISNPIKSEIETPDAVWAIIGPPAVPGGIPVYGWVKTGAVVKSTDITFTRRMTFTAKDNRAPNGAELWIVNMISTGNSDDLRQVVPVMAFAGSRYIGKDSGNKIAIRVSEKSKELRAFLSQP